MYLQMITLYSNTVQRLALFIATHSRNLALIYVYVCFCFQNDCKIPHTYFIEMPIYVVKISSSRDLCSFVSVTFKAGNN